MSFADYKDLELIGEGATGKVFKALRNGSAFAIKIMKPSSNPGDVAADLKFRRESGILSSLSHPCLVEVFETGYADGNPYMVMELISGQTLDERLKTGPLPYQTAVKVAIAVSDALAHVHSRGLLHRDVKPANIVLSSTDQIKLIDFGFAGKVGEKSAEVIGTLSYAPPEQSGALDLSVDQRSDLYALGATLFELVSGRMVFLSEEASQIIQAHASNEPVSLKSVAPGIPNALSEIVSKLLKKNPQDRYQSASSLAMDLRNLEKLENDFSDGKLALGSHSLNEFNKKGNELRLIGRLQELATLRKYKHEAFSGGALGVRVVGNLGIGKTHLLRTLVAESGVEEIVLVGRCQKTETAALGVFRNAIDELIVESMAAEPQVRDVVFDRFRRAGKDFAGVLKVFSKGLGIVFDRDQVAERLESVASDQERLFRALSTLIQNLGKLASVTILIDDAQWIDRATQTIIESAFANGYDGRLFFIETYKSDPDANQSSVGSKALGSSMRNMELPPLNPTECEELVSHLLDGGALSQNLFQQLLDSTEGNPYAVIENIYQVADAGYLVRRADGWYVDPSRESQINFFASIGDIVKKRLSGVSDDLLQLMRLTAVHGKEISLALLQDALGVTSEKFSDLQIELKASSLAIHRRPEVVSLASEKINEVLVASIAPDDLVALHRALAAAMLKNREETGVYYYAIAGHMLRSYKEHEAQIVVEVLLKSAQFAFVEYAYEKAVELLQSGSVFVEALKSDREAKSIKIIGEFHETLGLACVYSGKLQDAYPEFDKAIQLLKGAEERARILGHISLAHISLGRIKDCWNTARTGLTCLGFSIPRSKAGKLLIGLLTWGVCRFVIATNIGFGEAKGRSKVRRKLAHEISSLGANALVVEGSFALYKQLIVRNLLNTHFLGSSRENARSSIRYSNGLALIHGPSATKESVFFGERAVRLATDAGDLAMVGMCRFYLAMSYDFCGLTRKADELFYPSIIEVQKYWGLFDRLQCLSVLSFSLTFRGNSVQVLNLLGPELAHPERIGRFYEAMFSILVFSHLNITGRSEEASRLRVRLTDLSVKMKDNSRVQAYFNAFFLEEEIEANGASRAAEALASSIIASGFSNHQYRMPYLHIAYLAQIKLIECVDQEVHKSLTGDLKSAIEKAREKAIGPALSCHLYVLEATLARFQGQFKLALEYLDRSHEHANLAKSSYGLFEEMSERARFYQQVGDEFLAKTCARAAHRIAQTQNWKLRASRTLKKFNFAFDEKELVPTSEENSRAEVESPRIGQNYSEAILRVSIASATTLDPALQAKNALDELINILGAERGFLFLCSADSPQDTLRMVSGRDSNGNDLPELKGYSSTVVKQAAHQMKTVSVNGSDEGELIGSKSAVVNNLRSIMAAPLIFRTRVIGVVYLDSRLGRGGFNKERATVLSAVASQIAVAFETANMARLEAERRAIQRDLELTAAVQTFFLPQVDVYESAELKLCGYYQPANQASGDWWWYNLGPEKSIVLLVGDVTGHGAASAMLTASTAALVKKHFKAESVDSVDSLLEGLNKFFLETARGDFSMTMSAIEICADLKSIKWWNAGAPHLFFSKRNGEVRSLMSKGAPLGSEVFDVQPLMTDFSSGDRLFIFTDGLIELELPDGTQLRSRKLKDIFLRSREMSLFASREFIAEEMERLRGDRALDDDLTFVLVEF